MYVTMWQLCQFCFNAPYSSWGPSLVPMLCQPLKALVHCFTRLDAGRIEKVQHNSTLAASVMGVCLHVALPGKLYMCLPVALKVNLRGASVAPHLKSIMTL